MVRNSFRLTTRSLIVIIILALVPSLPAQAASSYGFTCSSCHLMPPLDSDTRDPSTGGFAGNHETHQPASATADDCARCHVTTGFTTEHLDGTIGFPASLNKSPAEARYEVGGTAVAYKNQTSTPVLGTCSNVNCHFETTTPTWGGAPYNSTADCLACHAVPGASAPHAKHDLYYTGTAGCVKCHPDWATGLRFSHATSAASRGIKVTMGEGSYSGTGLNYLPSQMASRSFGSCSGIYCHSPGDKATAYNPPLHSPSWDMTLNCLGCHKGDVASGTAIDTPAAGYGHTRHVNPVIAARIACFTCHSATVSTNTAITSRADHVDRFVTIRFNNSTTAVNGTYNGVAASATPYRKTPGSAPGSCQNIYCHSNGTRSTAPFTATTTPVWGSPLNGGCAGCHGGDRTTVAPMATSAHPKHVAGGVGGFSFGCDSCHAVTASGNAAILTPANHVNHRIDVDMAATWGGTYSATGHQPGAAAGTCSNVYCHSDGKGTYAAPVWNDPATGACGTCHRASAASINGVIRSKAHFAHFSSIYGPKLTMTDASQCSRCHDYSGETGMNHLNGAVNVTFSCTDNCHRQIAPANVVTAWGAGPVSCESCHTGTLSIIDNLVAPDKSGFATAGHGKIAVGMPGKNCLDCHARAQRHISGTLGDTNRTIEGLGDGTTNLSCTYCHNDQTKVTNPLFQNMSTHFTTLNGPQDMTCRSCHDLHGKIGNLSMIRGRIVFGAYSANITYTDTNTGMINTVTNLGLCQVCHTRTRFYKAGVSESRHASKDCFRCHKHDNPGGAFKPLPR